MDTFYAINNRKSTTTYKRDAIPLDTVLKVVSGARRAPSWGNKQCWKFIIVDSQVQKKIIGKASGQDKIAKACEDAPYIVVLCADTNESGIKNDLAYFMFDCGLAMENLVLAAEAENLATCIVGWFDEKAIRAVLNIPEEIKVIAFTPIGFAARRAVETTRKSESEVVFHNRWGNSDY